MIYISIALKPIENKFQLFVDGIRYVADSLKIANLAKFAATWVEKGPKAVSFFVSFSWFRFLFCFLSCFVFFFFFRSKSDMEEKRKKQWSYFY